MLTVGSLCTGTGALDHAVSDVFGDVRLAWVADPGSRLDDERWDFGAPTLLEHRYPGVPNLGDISTVDWSQVQPVDIITAGFPCTDVSCAGARAGLMPGTRSGVWTSVADAIAALRPPLVVIENVEGLLSARAYSNVEQCPWCVGDAPGGAPGITLRALGAVLGDLADLGFDAQWTTVAASDVGAPHRRRRVFVIAWPADTKGDARRILDGDRRTPADATRVGHGDVGPARVGGLPSAAVAGGAGADGLTLLPTPAARLSTRRGMPSADTAFERMYEQGRRNLEDAVALLPTPKSSDAKRGDSAAERARRSPSLTAVRALLPTPTAVPYGNNQSSSPGAAVRPSLSSLAPSLAASALLPTPRATDGTKGGPNQRGSSGDLMLPSAVLLLPTPTASHDGRNATAGRSDPRPSTNTNGWTLADVAYADRWGDYAPAIRRWESVLGRPAPEPTVPSRNHNPQLNPVFVEWLMGCDRGWVTDVPGLTRNQKLRLLGNGVVWQQGAYALRRLLTAALDSRSAS